MLLNCLQLLPDRTKSGEDASCSDHQILRVDVLQRLNATLWSKKEDSACGIVYVCNVCHVCVFHRLMNLIWMRRERIDNA